MFHVAAVAQVNNVLLQLSVEPKDGCYQYEST